MCIQLHGGHAVRYGVKLVVMSSTRLKTDLKPWAHNVVLHLHRQQITHLHWKAFKRHTFCLYFATYLNLFSGLNQSVVMTHNDVCCLCINDQRQG